MYIFSRATFMIPLNSWKCVGLGWGFTSDSFFMRVPWWPHWGCPAGVWVSLIHHGERLDTFPPLPIFFVESDTLISLDVSSICDKHSRQLEVSSPWQQERPTLTPGCGYHSLGLSFTHFLENNEVELFWRNNGSQRLSLSGELSH